MLKLNLLTNAKQLEPELYDIISDHHNNLLEIEEISITIFPGNGPIPPTILPNKLVKKFSVKCIATKDSNLSIKNPHNTSSIIGHKYTIYGNEINSYFLVSKDSATEHYKKQISFIKEKIKTIEKLFDTNARIRKAKALK